MHGINGTVAVPLARLPYEELCPGRDALAGAPETVPLGEEGTDLANPWPAPSPCDVIHRNLAAKPAA